MTKKITSKSGIIVDVTIDEEGRLTLSFVHPLVPSTSGKMGRTVRYYATYEADKNAWTGYSDNVTQMIGITLSDTDTASLQVEIAATKKIFTDRKDEERRRLEETLPKYRVLSRSGHYLTDTEILTVVLDPAEVQERYAAHLRGRLVSNSIDPTTVIINYADSPTAQKISVDTTRTVYTYGAVESALRIITAEEENQIKKEIAEAGTLRAEGKKDEVINEAEKIASLKEIALISGERQLIKQWVTNDCTAHLTDCSFHIARDWVLPDGKTEVTYEHCY